MELTSPTVWWPLVYGWATFLPPSIRSFTPYSTGRLSASSSGFSNASAANRPCPVWQLRPARLQSPPSSIDTAGAHQFTRDSPTNSSNRPPLPQLIAIDNEISFLIFPLDPIPATSVFLLLLLIVSYVSLLYHLIHITQSYTYNIEIYTHLSHVYMCILLV